METRKLPLRGPIAAGKCALVDGDYDGEYFAQFRWYLSRAGYVYRRGYGADRPMVYLHHEVAGQHAPGLWAYFKNGNRLDCRSSNIGLHTPSESAQARPLRRGASPWGYRGVRPMTLLWKPGDFKDPTKAPGTWYAICRGKYLGNFPNAEAAARAYDEAAKREWGDRAVLNFPEEEI